MWNGAAYNVYRRGTFLLRLGAANQDDGSAGRGRVGADGVRRAVCLLLGVSSLLVGI